MMLDYLSRQKCNLNATLETVIRTPETEVVNENSYNRFRNRRFFLAVGFSIVSKVASMGVQLLAIPIAIASCGMSTYVLYVQLVALSLLPCVLLIRFSPRFVGIISILHSEGEYFQLADVAKRGFSLSLYAGFVVSLIAASIPLIQRFSDFFQHRESCMAFAILSSCSILGGLLQSVEAVQSGVHENHLVSACYTFSNIVCTLLLVTFVPILRDIISLIFVLHVVPLIFRSVLTIYFLTRHRKYFSFRSTELTRQHPIALDAAGYTFMMGVCSYIGFQAPMLALASSSPERPFSNVLTLAFQFTLQGLGLLSIVLIPMVPVIATSWNSRNISLLQRYQRLIICTIIGATLIGMVLGIACGLWSLESLGINESQLIPIVFSAGSLLGVLALEQFLNTYLLTISASRGSFVVYCLTCVRSLLVFGVAMAAIQFGLHLYAMLFMAITIFLSACLPLQSLIVSRHQVKSLDGELADSSQK